MKYMLGDLLAVEEGIIAHQCNMYGVMGAGIARLLANKYEGLESSYREYCKEKKPHLGNVFAYVVNRKLVIANCFTQEDICMECAKDQNIGPELRSKIRDTAIQTTTDYHAIETAFNTLYEFYSKRTIYIPFLYGCGIAGGDWSIVENIMEEYKGELVVVCRPIDLQTYVQKRHINKQDMAYTSKFEKILATAEKLN